MPSFSRLLVACVLGATALHAQTVELATLATDSTLHIHDKVAVRNGMHRIIGRITGVRGDTLLLHRTLIPFTLRAPVATKTALQLRVGHVSRVRGAAVGALSGALAGLLLGVVVTDAFGGNTGDAFMAAGYFMPYTVPIAMLTGAIHPGDRWVRLRTSARTPAQAR